MIFGAVEVKLSLFSQGSKARAYRNPLGFWMMVLGGAALLASPASDMLMCLGLSLCGVANLTTVAVALWPELADKNQGLLMLDRAVKPAPDADLGGA